MFSYVTKIFTLYCEIRYFLKHHVFSISLNNTESHAQLVKSYVKVENIMIIFQDKNISTEITRFILENVHIFYYYCYYYHKGIFLMNLIVTILHLCYSCNPIKFSTHCKKRTDYKLRKIEFNYEVKCTMHSLQLPTT